MIEKNTTTNKVKISNAGYLIFSKDIANRLVDNLIVQNIGLFSENKEFRLRIYRKETFFTLPYVEKLCKSNQFIKKNNDMLRNLMYSIQ